MRLAPVSFASLLSLVLGAALAACNSFDPHYNDQPFLCGDDEPRCPDGYICLERGGREICHLEQSNDDPPDSGADAADVCRDTFEPNDDMALAQLTPVSELAARYHADALTLCPAGDRDHYGFTLRETGTALRVTVAVGGGAVDLAILNDAGAVVDIGSAAGTGIVETRLPRASTPGTLAPGTYFARVTSATPAEAAYTLDIVTCTGDPLCLD